MWMYKCLVKCVSARVCLVDFVEMFYKYRHYKSCIKHNAHQRGTTCCISKHKRIVAKMNQNIEIINYKFMVGFELYCPIVMDEIHAPNYWHCLFVYLLNHSPLAQCQLFFHHLYYMSYYWMLLVQMLLVQPLLVFVVALVELMSDFVLDL